MCVTRKYGKLSSIACISLAPDASVIIGSYHLPTYLPTQIINLGDLKAYVRSREYQADPRLCEVSESKVDLEVEHFVTHPY